MKLLDVLGGTVNVDKTVKPSDDYLIAFDGEIVVCYFYNTEPGKDILESYLKNSNATVNIDIRKMTLKKDNEFFVLNQGKKIVKLDDAYVLYEEVVELAQSQPIKGYKENKLKSGLNIFTKES